MKHEIKLKKPLKNREIQSVKVQGKSICITSLDEKMYAFENCCPHQYMPLESGFIRGKNIVCSLHGWSFNLETGVCKHNNDCTLKTYLLIRSGKKIFLELN